MQVISAQEAADLVRPGHTITVSGLVGNLVPEHLLAALERRFLETGEPGDLTEIHPWLYGGPDGTGLNRFAHPGFPKRIVGSTFILPVLSEAAPINRYVLDDRVEAYCWPANAIFQMLRSAERAVFRLGERGVELIEVGPGIDVEAQVLAVADFPIAVSDDVALMDERLFRPEPLGLALR